MVWNRIALRVWNVPELVSSRMGDQSCINKVEFGYATCYYWRGYLDFETRAYSITYSCLGKPEQDGRKVHTGNLTRTSGLVILT